MNFKDENVLIYVGWQAIFQEKTFTSISNLCSHSKHIIIHYIYNKPSAGLYKNTHQEKNSLDQVS